MALLYPPKLGDILMCDYPSCFAPPEMVKLRPVVVISPSSQGRAGLATVVPLSTTAPSPVLPHHCLIPNRFMPKSFQAEAEERWAKCDMICTLSLSRLELVRGPRDRRTGKRSYETGRLDLDHIRAVRRAVSAAFGIDSALFVEPPDPAAVTVVAVAAAAALVDPSCGTGGLE